MNEPPPFSARSLVPSLLVVGILFGIAEYGTSLFREEILAALAGHELAGMAVFVGTTMLATVLPFFSNLPLIPVATLLFGPLPTTALLILGWTIGSALSFTAARGYQAWMLRRFPALARFAFVDTLIHERTPSLSLIVLRMTFPVDILSYALGIFSRRVSSFANLWTTLIGVTPFAFLFGYFGALSSQAQTAVFVLSTIGFIIYLFVLNRLRHRLTPHAGRR